MPKLSEHRKIWLPSERSQGHGPVGTLLPIALAIAVVVVINIFAGRLVRATDPSHAIVRSKWELIERGPATDEPAWLILGDSSGNQGIDPSVLSPMLDAPAYNLCTLGDMLTVDSAWMLDRWTQEHGVPAGVVLVQVYDVWQREPSGNVFALIPPALFPEDPLPPLEFGWKERLTMRSVQYAPLVVLHSSLRDKVLNPGKAWRRLSGDGPFTGVGRMTDSGFLEIDRADPSNVEKDSRQHRSYMRLAGDDTAPSAANLAGLRRLLERCKELGVPVHCFPAPTSASLAAMPEFIERFETTQAMIRREFDAVGWGTVHVNAPVVFPDGRMQNADHLVTESAAEYTRMIGDAIGATPE